jgi:hypothetical protein
MQTVSPSTIRFVEIACDESGSEGENLVGGNTDVFAHASVRLDTESATNCVQEIRSRIRSPALEYKANHLLREKHRSVLRWLLGPSGPIHGHAHVQLTDKAFFVVGRVIDLLVGEADEASVLVQLRTNTRRTWLLPSIARDNLRSGANSGRPFWSRRVT